MKRITRPGGHRRRAWRLKKKHNKWFSCIIQKILMDTLSEMPQGLFENVWSNWNYDFCRLYK